MDELKRKIEELEALIKESQKLRENIFGIPKIDDTKTIEELSLSEMTGLPIKIQK